MTIEPRHKYDIPINVYVHADGRPAVTRRFELDVRRPQKVNVAFRDTKTPSSKWFDPFDVKPDLTLCSDGCHEVTMTTRGNRCATCASPKWKDDYE